MSKNAEPIRNHELAEEAIGFALDKKAEHCTLLNLEASAGIADWFVICQGDNPIQNKAIADAIEDGFNQKGAAPWHVEGYDEGRWILLDFSDVVIHVMLPEIRDHYQLEKLWPDAKRFDCRDEDVGDEF